MILGLMRKHAKSWLIKFIIVIICLVFVLYFGYSFRAQRGLRIAKVNGEVITRAEYQNEYDRLYRIFKQMYGESWNEKIAKALGLKRIALENLIDQRLMAQEAKRLGIKVNIQEIQEEIMKYPAFQRNGVFDIRLYKSLLRENRIDPEEFENSIKKQILSNKLKEFLLAFMNVTDQEALDYFRYKNEKIKVSFVLFKPDMFKDRVKVNKKMIEEFFKKHKERYRIPKMIKCVYIVIDPKEFENNIKPTEKEIQQYYNFHMDDYKLLGQKNPPPLKDVRDKVIRDLIEEKSIELAQEKGYELIDKMPYDIPLEEYAKENNLKIAYTDFFSLQDSTIPGIGGDRKTVETLFSLKNRDISDLMMLKGKFYIFQVKERKASFIPKLDSIYDQVKEDLIDELAMKEAKKEARAFLKKLRENPELWEEMIKKMGLELKETDFFKRSEQIPYIGGDQEIKEILFSLNKENRYPKDIYITENGAYVIRWEAREEPDEKEFQKQKYKLKTELAYIKRDRAFDMWVKSLRRSAKIKYLNPID